MSGDQRLDRNAAVRLFELAALASVSGQHDCASVYAGRAVEADAGNPSPVQLSRGTFNRLTVAYKLLVDDGRVGWHALNGPRRSEDGPQWSQTPLCDDRDDDDDLRSDRDRHVTEYMRGLARETVRLCREFRAIVDRHLLPGLQDAAPEDRAHTFKLKADFYRYAFEVSECPVKERSAAKACRYYQRGYDTLRRAQCGPLHPARSDLAVNFAVCLEVVFGAKYAAAFVLNEYAAATAVPAGDDGAAAAVHPFHLLRDRLALVRSDDDGDRDVPPAAYQLAPGFCTSDESDDESESSE